MSYLTQSGIDAVIAHESSGDPNAIEANSPLCTVQGNCSSATGLGQWITATWQSAAKSAGFDVNQYPTAASAPADIQYTVLQNTPASAWTYPGSSLAATLAQPGMTQATPLSGGNPYGASDVVSAPTTTDQANLSNYGYFGLPTAEGALSGIPDTSINSLMGSGSNNASNYGYFGLSGPSTSVADALGNSYPTSAGSSGALGTIFETLTNWFERGAVLILGIVIIAVGLWGLVRNTGAGRAVRRAAPVSL